VSEQLAITRSAVRLTRKASRHAFSTSTRREPDVLAVVLGAVLDEALSAVETLDLAARQDEDLAACPRAAARLRAEQVTGRQAA
jgi:hypothetical protein